jgi:hypothetical protein
MNLGSTPIRLSAVLKEEEVIKEGSMFFFKEGWPLRLVLWDS